MILIKTIRSFFLAAWLLAGISMPVLADMGAASEQSIDAANSAVVSIMVDQTEDIDEDGLERGLEYELGTDPSNKDSDGDSLEDGFEYLEPGYSPTSIDTDFDGIPDGEETFGNCHLYPGIDEDGDGCIHDLDLWASEGIADNCPSIVNHDQADDDGDGIGDVCDTMPYNSDGDMDGDGIADSNDNCPDWPNPDQANANNDEIGDACTCGDLSGDGLVNDWWNDSGIIALALWTASGGGDPVTEYIAKNTSSFTLDKLGRCDVDGDGVCTSADYKFINDAIAANDLSILPQRVCPSYGRVYARALNKLGYGLTEQDEQRLRALQAQHNIDRGLNDEIGENTNNYPAPEPYAGLDDYILEQIDPVQAEQLSEHPSLVARLAGYSNNAGNYDDIVVHRPTDGLTMAELDERYWNNGGGGRENHYFYPRHNNSDKRFLNASNSNRQLHAVLTDFWYNHFNVFGGTRNFGGKGMSLHEQALQDNMYGQFEDLVFASTTSAPMLEYLNLIENTRNNRNENFARELMELHTVGLSRPIAVSDGGGGWKTGYGYTYDAAMSPDGEIIAGDKLSGDNMIAVSRILTGWNGEYDFEYRSSKHDEGVKTLYFGAIDNLDTNDPWVPGIDPWRTAVQYDFNIGSMGEVTATPQSSSNQCLSLSDPGGYDQNGLGGFLEGYRLICILSRHPMSAELVSTKLMHRFLGDTAVTPVAPGSAVLIENDLLQSMISTWVDSNGDLYEVMKAMLVDNPSFKRSLYYEDVSLKRPTEFSASMVRALGRGSEGLSGTAEQPYAGSYEPSFNGILHWDIKLSGEGFYFAAPPTGYSDSSVAWSTAGATLSKFNSLARILAAPRTDLSSSKPVAYSTVRTGPDGVDKDICPASVSLDDCYVYQVGKHLNIDVLDYVDDPQLKVYDPTDVRKLVDDVAAAMNINLSGPTLAAIAEFVHDPVGVDEGSGPVIIGNDYGGEYEHDLWLERALIGVLATPEFLSQ